MPSWNIHTALVERILDDYDVAALGIADANIFLFGNYAPDIYVGFMVPDAKMRIDYCLTHVAKVSTIPIPDTDDFWDHYVVRRRPKTEAGMSLVLGVWAHLVADRFYNGRFREWSAKHAKLTGNALRIAKQSDFDLFGRALEISRLVEVTPELKDAAWKFIQYRILSEDVVRAVDVATTIVLEGGAPPEGAAEPATEYQLLDPAWIQGVMDDCVERIVVWLTTWQQLEAEGGSWQAADIRERAGLPPATPIE